MLKKLNYYLIWTIWNWNKWFAFSEYSESSKFYDATNKKVIWKMKLKAFQLLIMLNWSLRCTHSWKKIIKEEKEQKVLIKMLSKKMKYKEYIDLLLVETNKTWNEKNTK